MTTTETTETTETTTTEAAARPVGRLRRLLSGVRTRLLASFVVLLALSTVISVVAVRQILLARAGERVDDSLTQEVEEFRRLAREGRDPRTGRPFGSDVAAVLDVFLARNVPGEDEAFYTFLEGLPYRASSSDPILARPLASVPGLGEGRQTARATVETSGGPVRYLAAPVRVDGRVRGTFVVATFLRGERREIEAAVRVVAGVSITVLGLAGLFAFVLAGRVLAPLRELTETTRAISESDLSRRISVSGNDEVAALGRTFNGMLDRLEAAFASQKEFLRDAGHELRTPITIVRGHLELMGDDPQERRETVELVTDELDRMTRFVDDLLLLAKAERADFLDRRELELGAFTEELFVKLGALADRRWELGATAAAQIVADRQRLTQAIMNLAQNAVKVTSAGDCIELGSAAGEREIRLWVKDTGPGVADRDRQRIFERYGQATEGDVPLGGTGLGLSIVRAIVEAHGGRVELDTRRGAGSTFTCVIPAEPVARAVPA